MNRGLLIFIIIFVIVCILIGFYWAFVHKSRNDKNKEQLLGTSTTTAQAHNITINQQEPWNNNGNHVCPTCSQATHHHQHDHHPPQQFGNQPPQPFGNQPPPPPHQQPSQQFFNMPPSSNSNAMTEATAPESQHHTAIQMKNDLPPPPPPYGNNNMGPPVPVHTDNTAKNTTFQTNIVVHPPHSRDE
ncbi:hypothetical protein BDA99DRAFT_604487 [Phascolomyces articulosus]|uniref:Uncharacterized protein n=1 Tax=Phascolomyces articulosus TaxID=60185 RepID=A0AAD5K294_9FUNG|nr:hypothetical protein BDA99DRAFT_604487 [Phascolomyces articulosus]